VRHLRAVRRDLESLRQDERERARRIDLLSYQVDEIGAARLEPGEDAELDIERRRLANAEQLASLTSEALQALQQEEAEQMGALDLVGVAEQVLARLARIDPETEALGTQLAEATALLEDLSRELEHYRDAIEYNPHRLQQVEERLQLLHTLERKYGDSIEEVLAYGERAAAELQTITHAGERIEELEAEEARLLAELGRRGAALSAARRGAGERMARAIEAELADLHMERARFAAQVAWAPDPAGAVVTTEDAGAAGEEAGRYAFDSHGLDQIAFLVSANPGEPLRPLVKVASGGETARLMLALKTVLGRADETATLIFDEIDQGIGGRVGTTVGRKLWGLTAAGLGDGGAQPAGNTGSRIQHQVLCITHLPQLAAFGDTHFHVTKHVSGQRTVTHVAALAGDERVGELAAMMGADSQAGRASVTEIMTEVAHAKAAAAVPAGEPGRKAAKAATQR
jgi:DNA repair protein RecN (Recombination protein N)